jgi:protein-disulfide isomerase
MAEGRKAKVRGTPSVYINGRKFSSPSGYNLAAFTKVIDKHILKTGKKR